MLFRLVIHLTTLNVISCAVLFPATAYDAVAILDASSAWPFLACMWNSIASALVAGCSVMAVLAVGKCKTWG